MNEQTDFGFDRVSPNEKSRRVQAVFDSVAGRYDVMNDLMSAGLHRLWKRYAVEMSGVRKGSRVLDVAAGTGDLTKLLAERAGPTGEVWHTDMNGAMLHKGRNRLINAGYLLPSVRCNAQALPFPTDHFDCVMVAFGLRNVTDKALALSEMHRVLRPGGRLLVLEFSRIWRPLAPMYDAYSLKVLPILGQWVAKDGESYRYLAESIRKHPDQESLKAMLEQAGLARVEYWNLAAGVVAVHRGTKL